MKTRTSYLPRNRYKKQTTFLILLNPHQRYKKEYGGFNNFEKAITDDLTNKPFETLPHLLFIALKDKSAYKDEKGKEYPEVTEDNILDDYGLQDIEYISDVFNRAMYGSLPLENDEKKAEQEA